MAEPTRGRVLADQTRRALHAAVETGSAEQLTQLLDAHPGFVDALDDDGNTLLVRAVERGDLPTAKLLLDHGAHVNAHNAVGSVLELAARRADAPLVGLLLEHDARDVRVAFRIASERRDRPVMELLAYREPTLQVQMEFDADLPDQKLVNTELLSRRQHDPVLTLGPYLVHLTWDGLCQTFLEKAPGRPERTFSVEVQQRLRLLSEEVELGQLDGMWYSAVVSGPSVTPTDLGDDRWRVRYAYYAAAGAYEHYSAIDVTLDFRQRKLETVDVTDAAD